MILLLMIIVAVIGFVLLFYPLYFWDRIKAAVGGIL